MAPPIPRGKHDREHRFLRSIGLKANRSVGSFEFNYCAIVFCGLTPNQELSMNREPAVSRRIRQIRMTATMLVVACALAVVTAASSLAQSTPNSSAVTADEAAKIATDAYIYGYPLVTMEYTRRVLTNVASAGTGSLKAPMGQ